MRKGLLVIYWLCILGTFIQVPLLCFEFWLLATGIPFSALTVETLLTDHISFLLHSNHVVTKDWCGCLQIA